MRRRLSQSLRHRWRRIAITLLPLALALLHVTDALHLHALERLDQLIYDTRLRAFMPRTMDERIVIVDIDEKSLSQVGHWPWSRDKLARMVDELFLRQQIAALGFDVIFAEADGSSGLSQLQSLARGPFKSQAGFARAVEELAPALDYDAQLARAIDGRPVVLGYYFTSDKDGLVKGQLPSPVLEPAQLRGAPLQATSWNGYGANIPSLSRAAPRAGFFNSVTDSDGVVRFLPLLAEFEGEYYESLALAVFRTMLGMPEVRPHYAYGEPMGSHDVLQAVRLEQQGRSIDLPVDDRLATLIPFRGPGEAGGGSFRYVSASDVLNGALQAGSMRDAVVLVGSTAPGLMDLRVTPVARAYPGVETHANVLSALLDGRYIARPDYADGYDALQLIVVGLLLALALPSLSAGSAVGLSAGVLAAIAGVNVWLYAIHGLALPLATVLIMALVAFVLNMAYGYFVESRAKRGLATLFSTYVPPELVDEMVKAPERYSMEADSREMTVMFCDMRGFTAMSERMDPVQLQGLLNDVFSQLTQCIRRHRGTIDKYMGDCVMAFWGAPVATPDHAHLAVAAAVDMVEVIGRINVANADRQLPTIGVGVGLNSGTMCVGDMGSDIRRSYTVIGDAVNLGSRLEGLSKVYGCPVVVSDTTRGLAPQWSWMELDRVRVKGKEQAVTIFTPLAALSVGPTPDPVGWSTVHWEQFLSAYRSQDWSLCERCLMELRTSGIPAELLDEYASRVANLRHQVLPREWDAATRFDSK